MYGVILWSDERNDKALVWCEDHGKLAFYTAPPGVDTACAKFEAGDLVAFRLEQTAAMRTAHDIQVVSAEEFPHLADGLKSVEPGNRVSPQAMQNRPSDRVVPLYDSPAAGQVRVQASDGTSEKFPHRRGAMT